VKKAKYINDNKFLYALCTTTFLAQKEPTYFKDYIISSKVYNSLRYIMSVELGF